MYTYEDRDGISFNISDADYRKLCKFHKHHSKCPVGMSGEKFSYNFTPTGLGTAATVECSCGQKLFLGDFLDRKDEDYDPDKHPILTKEDLDNKAFESDVELILRLRSPRFYRIAFLSEQSFELLYTYICGLAHHADPRIRSSMLYKEAYAKNGTLIVHNYEKCKTDKDKINKFYRYFIKNVKKELKRYDCKNDKLLGLLNSPREDMVF